MQARLAFMSDPGGPSSRTPARRGSGGFRALRPTSVGGVPPTALLALDIETVPDAGLIPPDWPSDRFPKCAWHRIVAVSFVTADIARDRDGTETYSVTACRSGGEAGWDERRLLKAFWRFFEAGSYRVVTWNGRAFDMPVLLARSMMHGVEAPG